MECRRLAWLASLALMAVGGVVAHVFAYRLLAPPMHVHEQFAHWRLCLAICATVALAAVVLAAVARTSAGRSLHPPLWIFALLPPVGFVVQEHLERLLHELAVPYGTALEPVFLVGLALQLPFALAAYAIARALVIVAVAVIDRLRARSRPRLVSLFLSAPVSAGGERPRLLAFTLGHGQRAPPSLPA